MNNTFGGSDDTGRCGAGRCGTDSVESQAMTQITMLSNAAILDIVQTHRVENASAYRVAEITRTLTKARRAAARTHGVAPRHLALDSTAIHARPKMHTSIAGNRKRDEAKVINVGASERHEVRVVLPYSPIGPWLLVEHAVEAKHARLRARVPPCIQVPP